MPLPVHAAQPARDWLRRNAFFHGFASEIFWGYH
jgi:hypothetical protein